MKSLKLTQEEGQYFLKDDAEITFDNSFNDFIHLALRILTNHMAHGAVGMDEISPLQSSPEAVRGTCKYEFVVFLICFFICFRFYCKWPSRRVTSSNMCRESRGKRYFK